MDNTFGSSTVFFQKGIITSLNHGLHCSTPLQFHDNRMISPRSFDPIKVTVTVKVNL